MKIRTMSTIRNRWLKLQGATMRAMPGMMTCAQFDAFICDYLDGKLPLPQALAFRLHMGLCADCRSYLAAYRNTIELQRQLLRVPEAPVPDDVPEDLVRAVLAARAKTH